MLSNLFSIKSGVRQGGINSPWFFNVYINDLILLLKGNGHGCTIAGEYVGCLFFADDIMLISASIVQMQLMLHTCELYGKEFCIAFNAKKSHLLQVGLEVNVILPKMFLSGVF